MPHYLLMATQEQMRMIPSIDLSLDVIRYAREDAARAGDAHREVVCYSILWWVSTGREFTGLQRALAHMTRPTLLAFVKRVEKAMKVRASNHGREVAVTGELDNPLLARALGCASWEEAQTVCVEHPYGTPFTLTRRGAR